MKFGVVIFPGSNCDKDMIDTLQYNFNQEVVQLWHKDSVIENFGKNDCIILPGGFSYGDYLRCGAMASFSPIMKAIIEHANNGGIVFGVCNGFQILCEANLLPGVLLRNAHQRYECNNVLLKSSLSNEILKIPIAHAEGRYFADESTLNLLEKNNQILYKYCDENGDTTKDANPNGSTLNIAGICNETRNVFGMMPHPERASSITLNNTDGKIVFEEILNLKLQLA